MILVGGTTEEVGTMRTTIKNVRARFELLVTLAQQCGVDVTGWSLQEASDGQQYRLFVVRGSGQGQHPMGEYIGSTAREAYDWLGAANAAFGAVIGAGSLPR